MFSPFKLCALSSVFVLLHCRISWCSRLCCGWKILLNPWISTPESSAWSESIVLSTSQNWVWWRKWFSLCCVKSSRLLQKFDFPSMRFSLFFLGYEDKKEIPTGLEERTAWTFSRRATIELTQWVDAQSWSLCGRNCFATNLISPELPFWGHNVAFPVHISVFNNVTIVVLDVLLLPSFLSVSNWGSESDESQSYHNGNSDPRGFGNNALQFLIFIFICCMWIDMYWLARGKSRCSLCNCLVVYIHSTGHIGIAVPDVDVACKLFEEQGVTFVKKPNDGKDVTHLWKWCSQMG